MHPNDKCIFKHFQCCIWDWHTSAKSQLKIQSADYLLSCRSLAHGHGFCVMVNRVSEMSDKRQSRSNMCASTGAASGSWYIWLDHFSSLAWQIWPWSSQTISHQTSSDMQSQSLIYPSEGSLQTRLKRQMTHWWHLVLPTCIWHVQYLVLYAKCENVCCTEKCMRQKAIKYDQILLVPLFVSYVQNLWIQLPLKIQQCQLSKTQFTKNDTRVAVAPPPRSHLVCRKPASQKHVT